MRSLTERLVMLAGREQITEVLEKVLEAEVFQDDPVRVLTWQFEGERILGILLTLDKEAMDFTVSRQGFTYQQSQKSISYLRGLVSSRQDSTSLEFHAGVLVSRMDASSKACSKGNPCGASCIEKGDNCRLSTPRAKAAASKILNYAIGTTTSPNLAPSVKHHKEVQEIIDLGAKDAAALASDSRIQNKLTEYQQINQVLAERKSRLKEIQNLYDEAFWDKSEGELNDISQRYRNYYRNEMLPVIVRHQKAAEECDKLLEPFMEKQRKALLSRDAATVKRAKDNAAKVKIASGDARIDQQVKAEIEEFYILTGGGLQKLRAVGITDSDRLYADTNNGFINLGFAGKRDLRTGTKEDKDFAKSQVFHELAHFTEAENPQLLRIAEKWREKRATGKPKLMSELSHADYGDDEVAVPDHFVDPYVGRVYPPAYKATEVISMGFERFSSAKSMAKLYRDDPEFFNLIAGVAKKYG